MNKVMLLNLPVQNYVMKNLVKVYDYNPSLSLVYLGTSLDLHGYKPIIIDLCFDTMNTEGLLAKIAEENPIMIGISVYTENIEMAIALSKAIKQRFPEIKILLGGPHPSVEPEDGVNTDYVDFVIRKEGEATIIELLEAITSNETMIRYEDIPGLVFKRDGKIVKNILRSGITNLDLMPLPKRELGDINRYGTITGVVTSRGCPGNCIYCAGTALSGNAYRVRDVDNVFLEIVLLNVTLKAGITKVYIVDDTFTVFPERVYRFIDLLNEYKLDIEWECHSRIDIMTEELLDKMATSNCTCISYGIESGSQEVLNKIRKNMDIEHARKVIEWTYKRKIIPKLYFMVGHYCDTKETLQQTLNFIKEVFMKFKPEIHLNSNTPFPGTYQYTHREELGLKSISDSFSKYSVIEPIVETDNFTIYDQRDIILKAAPCLLYHTRIELLKPEFESL